MPINNGLLPLLTDHISRTESWESVSQSWFYEQVRRARASENIELAELMYACAIPASFDIHLIGILREQPNDSTFNGWLFDALISLSFIRRANGGGYCYTPTVRDRILADFADQSREPLFKHYTQLLLDHYLSEAQRLYRRGQFEVAYFMTDYALALPRLSYPPRPADLDFTVTTDPFVPIYLWRGRILDAVHRTQDAIREYDQAIRHAPDFGDPYFHRGMDYESLSDHLMALEDLSQSIRLQPEDGYNYWGRGYIYYQTAQYELALQDFDWAVHYQPGLARNYHWRACAYRALKDFRPALSDHTRAIELDPRNATFINHRGITYDNLGDHEAAISDYSYAITLEPHDAAFFYNRANAYYSIGDYELALSDYQIALQREPNNPNIQVQCGLIHDQLGHYAEALTAYTRAIELDPLSAMAYTFRALIRFPIDPHTALHDASRAIELEPDETTHLYWYAVIALSCGLTEKAEEAIAHALVVHPEDAMTHYWHGLIALSRGDQTTAFAELEWSITIRDDIDNRVYGILWRWIVATLDQNDSDSEAGSDAQTAQMLYNRLQEILLDVTNPVQRRKLACLIALTQGQIEEARLPVESVPPLGLSNISLLYSYVSLIAHRWPEQHGPEAVRAWFESHLQARYRRANVPHRTEDNS